MYIYKDTLSLQWFHATKLVPSGTRDDGMATQHEAGHIMTINEREKEVAMNNKCRGDRERVRELV